MTTAVSTLTDRVTDLVTALGNDAARLYGDGYAGRDDIDTAMRLGCGLPSGPLRLLDEMGLAAARDRLEILYARTGAPDHRPAPALVDLLRAGRPGFHDSADPPAEALAGQPDRSPFTRIGILGSGTMAAGIAQVITAAGLDTVVVARTGRRALDLRSRVDAALTRRVGQGRLSEDQRAATLSRLSTGDSLRHLRDCDMVIEAVAEDPAVKQAVFAGLDRICASGAVLATTTSSLSVGDCAVAGRRPHATVGLHFFNPAPAMPLVEVVRTTTVDERTFTAALTFVRYLGKHPGRVHGPGRVHRQPAAVPLPQRCRRAAGVLGCRGGGRGRARRVPARLPDGSDAVARHHRPGRLPGHSTALVREPGPAQAPARAPAGRPRPAGPPRPQERSGFPPLPRLLSSSPSTEEICHGTPPVHLRVGHGRPPGQDR